MADNSAWNFQGWIGVRLEGDARERLSLGDGEVRETIFCADALRAGTFVEAMLYILRTVHGYEKDLTEFSLLAQGHLGKSANEIPKEKIQELFDEYRKLLTSQYESALLCTEEDGE